MESICLNKYMNKIDLEYFSATNGGNFDNFTKWHDNKRKNLKLYYDFMRELNLNSEEPLIELDKGFLDTIALVNKRQKIIEISEYPSMMLFNNVNHCVGRLVIRNGNLTIKNSSNSIRYDLRNQQYALQYPMDKGTEEITRYLAFLNEQLFIGAYGNTTDYNRNDIINSLKNTNDILLSSGIKTEFEQTTINDRYAIILKNKIQTKIRERRR